jgi:hypothetical protein
MIGPVANAGLKKLELFTKWFKVYDILRHFVPLTMQANSRLESLDVFRGLTVAAMILVNNPGTWEHIYSPSKACPVEWLYPYGSHLSVFSIYCRGVYSFCLSD